MVQFLFVISVLKRKHEYDLRVQQIRNQHFPTKISKLDGKSTWWSKKGQKLKQKNYKNGKLDGKLIEWFRFNGEIKREENYKNGMHCFDQC